MTMTAARHGKRAAHSWAQLPPEILRLVVQNYLASRPYLYLPSSWSHPDFHYQRVVFESLRDAYDIQLLMAVCPQWHRSLSNLDFWAVACRKLDRHDLLGRSIISREIQAAAQAAALGASAHTPVDLQLVHDYNHFMLLSQSCCLPCRINRPHNKDGIGCVKALIPTALFGQVPVCKLHRNNVFCGVCLKDLTLASLGDHGQFSRVPDSLFENEDFETWPTVHTTCYHCRRDALLRTVLMYSNPQFDLFEFVGGATFNTKDYEVRSAIDSFVDMAENGVGEVMNVLFERHWLRTNTNLVSLLDQAVASARYSRAEFEEYESEEEMLSDDEEDTYDMLQTQEELGGVRNLAMIAWARVRIMDGNWVSPGDIWCFGTGQLPADSTWDPSKPLPTLHPVPYSLQPSPSNESSSLTASEGDDTTSTDPSSPIEQPLHYPTPDRHTPLPNFRFAQGASSVFRGTFRDILLDPMRHIVGRLMHEAQEAKQDPCVRVARVDTESVLALLRDERTWYINAGGGPRLMNAIPYVPTSYRNLPPHTRNLVDGLWREACAPLFQCQCSICDRAMRNQAQGQVARDSQRAVPQQQPQQRQESQPQPPVVVPSQEPPRQVVLVQRTDTPRIESPPVVPTTALSPDTTTDVRSRKRSSAERDDPEEQLNYTDDNASIGDGTPRKRQRTGDAHTDDDAAISSEPPSGAESPVGESDLGGGSGGGTGPGSPANSTGVPSETSVSSRSSSASDSSSLRSVENGAALAGSVVALQQQHHPMHMRFKNVVVSGGGNEHVKVVRDSDEERVYEDAEDEGVVYLH